MSWTNEPAKLPAHITADVFARAIIAAARAYDVEPERPFRDPTRAGRKVFTAAASGMARALEIEVSPLQRVLGLARSTVFSARNKASAQFTEAEQAAARAVRYAYWRPEAAASVVEALPLAAVGQDEIAPDVTARDLELATQFDRAVDDELHADLEREIAETPAEVEAAFADDEDADAVFDRPGICSSCQLDGSLRNALGLCVDCFEQLPDSEVEPVQASAAPAADLIPISKDPRTQAQVAAIIQLRDAQRAGCERRSPAEPPLSLPPAPKPPRPALQVTSTQPRAGYPVDLTRRSAPLQPASAETPVGELVLAALQAGEAISSMGIASLIDRKEMVVVSTLKQLEVAGLVRSEPCTAGPRAFVWSRAEAAQ